MSKDSFVTEDSIFIFSSYNLIQEANSWRESAIILLEKSQIKLPPYVMLLFSSELYLKSLLMCLDVDFTKNFKGKKGHNLSLLYENIPDKELKKAIKSVKVNKLVLGDKVLTNFDDYLNYVSNGFINYRYNFETFLKNELINIPTEFIINFNTILYKNCKSIVFDMEDENGNYKKMDGPNIVVHYKSDYKNE